MRTAALVFAALAGIGCEQYHPTAATHVRPASEEDRAFATAVDEDGSRRRVINKVETRAGPVVEPVLDARPRLSLWRLSLTGPVAIAEGSLDGRAFAGVYWTRDDEIVAQREWQGAAVTDAFAPDGPTRLRAAGDARQLSRARDIVSGKADPPLELVYRDADVGSQDGGASRLREAIGAGRRVRDGWSVGKLAVVVTERALWTVRFESGEIVEVSHYGTETTHEGDD